MQTKERYQLQRLTLLALLTAMCVVLRIFKIIDIPNVQPVTDIIMLTTLELGAGTGILLAILVMVISNIFLGFGIWTLSQIFAYAACALTVALFARLLPLKSRKFFWLQELLAGFLGRPGIRLLRQPGHGCLGRLGSLHCLLGQRPDL